jgi:arylformamidase
MSWIDISVALRNGMVHWPGDQPYLLTRVADMARDGTAYNLSIVQSSVHMGTHMDAPLHFVRDGRTMESMPLDATLGPCRVIEIQDPARVTIAELEPYAIQPGERILLKTRNSFRQWRTDQFLEDYVYLPVDTARYLARCEIRTIGVDALSVGGFPDAADNPEVHRILLGAGIWIIEWLDLSSVKPGRYELACLPLKMVNSEGAPARAALRPL